MTDIVIVNGARTALYDLTVATILKVALWLILSCGIVQFQFTGALIVPLSALLRVTITKKVDGVKQKEVAVGQDFTYQIVVKNSGQVNLTNVVVGDVAPAGVTPGVGIFTSALV